MNTAGVVRSGAVELADLPSDAAQIFLQRADVSLTASGRVRAASARFHQIGVELLGVAQAQADIEVIALGRRILDALGIGDRVVLELNTLGDPESRAAYRDALVAYFSSRRAEVSEDSQRRLDANPLRILDSKDPGDIQLNAAAPAFDRYLSDGSLGFFALVRAGLERLGIDYRLNPRLVRGLDYYCPTVFEFVTTDLGAQGTQCWRAADIDGLKSS